jgi:C-terminal processing protease CtpA/Prc
MIGTGFSFEDGEQILVSVQKPMGMVLEQDDDQSNNKIVVTELDPSASAARAGVQVGDVLVAVQNASVEQVDLDSVLGFIQNGPRVMNLRFQRTIIG